MPANFCCHTRDFLARGAKLKRASQQVSGGYTARVTPVPIPNTEVKPRWADDTARVTAWERRSLPGLNSRKPQVSVDTWGFCFFAEILFSFSFCLEAVAESEGDGRVVLERRELVVNFGLFRADVRLDRGVARSIDAVESVKAGVAGQVQFCAGRSLKDGAQLEIESEVAGGRNEVAKSEHCCRCDFPEVQLAGAGDGIAGIARIGHAAESEGTATGNVGRSRSAVSIVHKQAGT